MRGAAVRGGGVPRRVAGVLLLCGASCGPGLHSVEPVVESFLTAVQDEDTAALFCLLAGATGGEDGSGDGGAATRSDFEAWVASRLADYREGRDAGWVDTGDDGVVAVKLFALGRGTYYELRELRRLGPDAVRVRMDLRLGYQAVDLSGFSPGTTFYLCGLPVGRVHAIVKPARGGEESVEVLDRVALEWTLVRSEAGGGCPARWTVASLTPIEGTEASRQVTWVF